jgi:hypothetical protein
MFPTQDTSPETQAVYRSLMMAKTPQERLLMGLKMAEEGMKMWFVRIQHVHPHYTHDQVRAKMLQEMLRNDPTLVWVRDLAVFKTL